MRFCITQWRKLLAVAIQALMCLWVCAWNLQPRSLTDNNFLLNETRDLRLKVHTHPLHHSYNHFGLIPFWLVVFKPRILVSRPKLVGLRLFWTWKYKAQVESISCLKIQTTTTIGQLFLKVVYPYSACEYLCMCVCPSLPEWIVGQHWMFHLIILIFETTFDWSWEFHEWSSS